MSWRSDSSFDRGIAMATEDVQSTAAQVSFEVRSFRDSSSTTPLHKSSNDVTMAARKLKELNESVHGMRGVVETDSEARSREATANRPESSSPSPARLGSLSSLPPSYLTIVSRTSSVYATSSV